VSSHAFHFFDQPAALAEFQRVLAPGGLLAIAVVNPRTRLGATITSMGTAGAATFPNDRDMRALVHGAGFVAVSQRRVRRALMGPLAPDLITLGRVPGH
jgi:ubiquinone/menaquinone biosynthesis C-methylase UbiE